MRDPFTFVVPLARRKPFTLTVAAGNGCTMSLTCPVEGKRVRMPVQGVFREAVVELVRIGAVVIPNGGSLPPEEK